MLVIILAMLACSIDTETRLPTKDLDMFARIMQCRSPNLLFYSFFSTTLVEFYYLYQS